MNTKLYSPVYLSGKNGRQSYELTSLQSAFFVDGDS